jgi:hypothetical protein
MVGRGSLLLKNVTLLDFEGGSRSLPLATDEITKGCGPDWLPTRRKTLRHTGTPKDFHHEGVAPRANAIRVLLCWVGGGGFVTKYEQTLAQRLGGSYKQRPAVSASDRTWAVS